MSDIRFDVKNARQVGLRFDQFPDQLREDLQKEVTALTRELYARVQAATPNRTGRLLSQERLRIFVDQNRITGYIDIDGEGTGGSSDFAKAAALEYGASRPAKVSAHTMSLNHAWDRILASPIRVMVQAYTRPSNLAARMFERGPLAAMQPEIALRLNAAVEAAVAKANA